MTLNKQALRYGNNVLWFLNELAAYDANDIDGGEFDVYGEDRNGLEGCSTIDVTELAADAAKLIEAAEKRMAELSHHLQCAHAFIEHTEAFGYGAKSGILCCGDTQWDIDSSKSALRAAGIKIKGE